MIEVGESTDRKLSDDDSASARASAVEAPTSRSRDTERDEEDSPPVIARVGAAAEIAALAGEAAADALSSADNTSTNARWIGAERGSVVDGCCAADSDDAAGRSVGPADGECAGISTASESDPSSGNGPRVTDDDASSPVAATASTGSTAPGVPTLGVR